MRWYFCVLVGNACTCRAKEDRAAAYWLRSGRAETEGRLEQWYEYLSLQVRGVAVAVAVAAVVVVVVVVVWMVVTAGKWEVAGPEVVWMAAAAGERKMAGAVVAWWTSTAC